MQLMMLTFLSIFTLTLAGVYLSHKIGGPIYQLNKYLKQVIRGECDPRRIRFRKYDFFAELATDFNRYQENYGVIPKEADAPGQPGSAPAEGDPKAQSETAESP